MPPELELEDDVDPPHSVLHSVGQPVLQMQLRMALYAFCPEVPAAFQQFSAQVWVVQLLMQLRSVLHAELLVQAL